MATITIKNTANKILTIYMLRVRFPSMKLKEAKAYSEGTPLDIMGDINHFNLANEIYCDIIGTGAEAEITPKPEPEELHIIMKESRDEIEYLTKRIESAKQLLNQ